MGKALVGLTTVAAAVVSTLAAFGLISPADASERLTESAQKSLETGASRIKLDVRADVGDEAIAFTATGAFDYVAGRGEVLYNFSRVRGLEDTPLVRGRFVENIAFIELPRGMLPREVKWVQVDLVGVNQLLRDLAEAGIAPQATVELGILADVSVANPAGVLKELRRAGEAKKIDDANPLGVQTEVFQGTLPLTNSAQRLRAKAWIGKDDGLIHRLELRGDRAGGHLEADITFAYASDIRVEDAVPKKHVLASDLYGRLSTPR